MIPPEDSVVIEGVYPEVDGGRYPVKRVVGQTFEVFADIFSHGHEVVQARLLYREQDAKQWQETEMRALGNDRWRGSFLLERNTTYLYTLMAWRDPFRSWLQYMRKKYPPDSATAASPELASDLQEGCRVIAHAAQQAEANDRQRLEETLVRLSEIDSRSSLQQAIELANQVLQRAREGAEVVEQLQQLTGLLDRAERATSLGHRPATELAFSPELDAIMSQYPDRSDRGRYPRELEVVVDRREAQYASWYEMWPRSQGTTPNRSATFADMERRLPEIRALGFHVLYLGPIHPIGRTNRKGPNNSLVCPPGSPGCPYAIGDQLGGHTAIHPDLGTLEDFRRFERAVRSHGMEIALDLALQASPDHPWVKEHPEWFNQRPDGSIRYAENPPKKYEDIYPLNFHTSDREGLWQACLELFRFWMKEGVRIFRVDNPHTKPMQFWHWLIARLRDTDPDVIFLAEAFTRPKVMKALAKAGFTQSYTYFTWRNFKHELTEYFTELTAPDTADVMRGNLFTNTPDILPQILQNAPRSAFMMRALLAGTLSPLWGMYNGFELCEGTPRPGTEEYLDSEKYQHKVWDWDRPGNIKPFIGRLNQIREEQPALQLHQNLRFLPTDNDNLLAYSKWTDDESNRIIVVVNLDPYKAHEGHVTVPLAELGLRDAETYQLHDLLDDKRYFWRGPRNYVRLDPDNAVGHIFRLLRWSHREHDFDYFY